MANLERDIFQAGSTTYYWSTRFFPRAVRADVVRLYSFVRTADNYVDHQPPRPAAFRHLCAAWQTAHDDPAYTTAPHPADSIEERVVKNMVAVARHRAIDSVWVDAFLHAMAADLAPQPHRTLGHSLQYVYGSAEVIGLMMCRILGLPKDADAAARLQGRAMQWINFIRDIAEDNALGRSYFPQADLRRFGLADLQEATARRNPAAFARFIDFQLQRYHAWQSQAEAGYRFIPRRLRLPLRTAADMYTWTAHTIAADPFVVFTRKVKPRTSRVILQALRRTLPT